MISFIKTVVLDLVKKDYQLQELCFVLPSKRAGVFLKHELASILKQPIFSPQIFSIEEFVEQLSGLKALPDTELLFRLYKSYKHLTKKEDLEGFETFSKWGQILLQDFNEIDRYLIPQAQIFDYLKAITEIKHWSLDATKTDLVIRHLKFWNSLKEYYEEYTKDLLDNKTGYQGLIYREAVKNLEIYIENNNKKHIFVGFNALNTAESQIIQGLLKNDLCDIYWDIDEHFIEDKLHDAGTFTRQHKTQWNYFKTEPFNWITKHYSSSKKIDVVGVPKRVGQAKYIGQLLEKLQKRAQKLSSTAVILGEEDLLIPVLNALPEKIEKLNVTMGMPLKVIPLANLFENLFKLHKSDSKKLYHKDVIALISDPAIFKLFNDTKTNTGTDILNYITKNNTVYIEVNELKKRYKQKEELINLLFNSWDNNPKTALKNCILLLFKIKESLEDDSDSAIQLEYLYRFNTLFNQLITLNTTYSYIDSITILYTLYKELLNTETLDFKGEPLEGLQIMGMLESRVLDFETVIISAVNEGILPSGKTNNSFIPFDVKLENNLPTYKEKDAVYTYHFYRLLQKAKHVYIIYNTEVDALKGGEKSRFITQLEIEKKHKINYSIATTDIPQHENQLEEIIKTQEVINQLQKYANKGFSPSSLTNYIRNPIDFYYDKILNIKDAEDVEEHIAANTLGSVIHNTLEAFYKPLEGTFLTTSVVEAMKTKIKTTITQHFKNLYKEGDFSNGKNLLIFEIAQRYILNFLNLEIKDLKNGNTIKIVAIESEETVSITLNAINTPIKLKGKVDRVDVYNDTLRVVDYKTGKVMQNDVEIINWENITSNYKKYSKPFQILCYAYMLYQNKKIALPIEAGIISFKNLNAGFLKFGTKLTSGSRTKNQIITNETLDKFETELHKLILEIFNTDINFIEKEVE